MLTRKEIFELKGKERNEAFDEVWKKIKEAVESSANNAEAIEALKIVRPSLYGSTGVGRSSGNPRFVMFANMFEKKGSQVDELEVFKQLKIGRKDAIKLIKESLRKSSPETRKWISFNPDTGIYTCEKIGADAPKNWTGYNPNSDESLSFEFDENAVPEETSL